MGPAVRAIARFAATAGVWVLASSLPVAQQPAGRATLPSWDAWFYAINTHEPGERDQAVADIAPWSLKDLHIVLQNVPRQFTTDQLRMVARGVVLHADVAILHRVPGGYDLPAGPTTIVLLKDGRRVGQMASTEHWEFARRLLSAIPKNEERTRLGRQFYRAAGAVGVRADPRRSEGPLHAGLHADRGAGGRLPRADGSGAGGPGSSAARVSRAVSGLAARPVLHDDATDSVRAEPRSSRSECRTARAGDPGALR